MIKTFIFLISCIYLHQSNAVLIKGRGYEGYIFNENHTIGFSIPDQKGRFTPSVKDIDYAEKLLKEKIRSLNRLHENQMEGCPVIEKKLRKYKRQYVGFVNKNNEKIIWVNFIWHRNAGSWISEDIIFAMDGCSHYWKVKINLNQHVVYDLVVNGLG